ncbi:hypothetical protein L7F22_006106 [Adiantum nelumboides]|nr:hypothetical protein [Adiantum nelumboides]
METFITNPSSDLFQASAAITLLLALLLFLKLLFQYISLPLTLPPGPPAWPLLGSWLQFPHGLNSHSLSDLTRKYGEIFLLKLGQQNLLVISSPDLAFEVLQRQGAQFGARPRGLFFDTITSKGQDLVFSDYGEHHIKVRRICTPAFFSNKVIQQCRQGWEEEITINMDHLRHVIPGAATTGIIVKDHLQLMMYSIVYRMMFSRRFEGLDDPVYLELQRLNENLRRIVVTSKTHHSDFFPCLKPFLKGYLSKVWSANQERLTFFRKAFIDDHRKRQLRHIKSGVDDILEAHANGELSEETMLYLVQNINVAAIDTTVSVMEWGVAELVNNRHVQEDLRRELDTVLGKGVPVSEPDLTKLPYLQAVVKELLRLHMVVPLLLPHQNLKPTKIGAYDIPAGCKVYVNARGMANDPEYWNNPEAFDPNRFLESKLEMRGSHMHFMPFGSGRRSCPGMAMAVVVLSLVLGRMVQEYELLPFEGEKLDLTAMGGIIDAHIIAEKSRIMLRPRNT